MTLEDIYGIIDLLIHKKYLDSIPSSHVSIPKPKGIQSATNEDINLTIIKSKVDLFDELNNLAREKYHIYDLNQLEKEMDAYCFAILRLSTLTTGNTIQQQLQKEENVIKLTKIRILKAFCQSDEELDENYRNSILNFVENHHLYEEELKDKLGIIFTPELSDQITNAYHRDEERRQWNTKLTQFANVAFYGAVVGIPVMILTILFKPN